MTASDSAAERLTTSPAKARAYRDDIWMRESWFDAQGVLDSPEHTLHRFTYVLVKPETAATRRIALLLAELRRRGFAELHAVRVRLDPHRVRTLWQYQLNSAPVATLAAVDLVVRAGPAFVVLLRDDAPEADTSACSRLAAMKGSTHGARHPDDLRVLLGGGVPLFSFLHVPDEPADLVRELGIWFERPARRCLYRALADGAGVVGGGPALVDEVARAAERDCATTDLDHVRALDRLAVGSEVHRHLARRIRSRLAAPPADIGDADRDLAEMVAQLAGFDAVPEWDRVTLAAVLVAGQGPVGPALL